MIEFNQVRADDPASWRQGYGGDTSNMAIAAARLGARVAYVTRLGDDAFGAQFRALWRAEGVVRRGRRDRRRTRRPASTSSRTGRRGTRSPTCARARRRARSRRRTCRSTVIARARAPARVRHQPGDLDVGLRRGLRGDRTPCARPAAASTTTRTCGRKLWPLRTRRRDRARDDGARRLVPAVARGRRVDVRRRRARRGDRRPAARAGARGIVYKRGADGCVVDDGRARVVARAASRRDASTPPAPATASTAPSPRGSPPATTRSRRRASPTPRRRCATTGYGAVEPLPRAAEVARLLRAAAWSRTMSTPSATTSTPAAWCS